MPHEKSTVSPKWSASTKIIVTLLFFAGVLALIIRFSNLLNTLVTAFIIAVLYHPVAEWICKKTRLPWAWSVSVIYFLTVIAVFGLLTVGGLAIINQVGGLIKFLQETLYELPKFFNQLTATNIVLGPFNFNFSYINWSQVGNQLLTTIEPILNKIGTFFGDIATGTVGIVGSFFFSLLISFLVITETEGVRGKMFKLEIPGYEGDFKKLGERINPIWNKFVRGQAVIFIGRFTLYLILLSILRLRFAVGMALLATLGAFIPYVGVAIVWIINFFIAFYQGSTIFGLAAFPYALIVMGIGWVSDLIYDTMVSTKIMANVLKLHPAAVLVAILVGLNLFGFLGMLLAPPVLSSLIVLIEYSEKKLLDKDPWEVEEVKEIPKPPEPLLVRTMKNIRTNLKNVIEKQKNN
jgi:predicted PurR-regulated permease PerM